MATRLLKMEVALRHNKFMHRNYFIVFLLFLMIFFSQDVWASEKLDQVAKDNISPALAQKAQDGWERRNELLAASNQPGDVYFFPPIPEDEKITWTYEQADLDGAGITNYLIIFYHTEGGDSIVILKDINGSYTKVWETPLDLVFGLNSPSLMIDDLDGDGIPEILIHTELNLTTLTYLIEWKGPASQLIYPPKNENSGTQLPEWVNLEVLDINGDGKKELLQRFYNEYTTMTPDGPELEQEYYYIICKFDGGQPVYIDDDAQLLDSTIQIIPTQWFLSWANTSQPERIKATLSDIEESHPVNEINPASVRLEDRVLPTRTYIDNGKFIAEFDKQEVMIYLLKAPRLKPLAVGDKINITLSALLPSGQYVSGSSEIEIVEEPKTIPFSQFNIKHWRINWHQNKHDKNKFHLAGKIDLPDDYTLDLLQKKGAVTITIEKKNSASFSQNTTLDFKQKGPIWRYKAPKAQNGTQQLLDIEKMLIFWQPEAAQNKPGKGHRKRTGWFMIQGNINLSAADQAALLPKASLTLNIPIENITTASSLESATTVDFTVQKDHWFYKTPPRNPDWKEDWWDDIKDEE